MAVVFDNNPVQRVDFGESIGGIIQTYYPDYVLYDNQLIIPDLDGGYFWVLPSTNGTLTFEKKHPSATDSPNKNLQYSTDQLNWITSNISAISINLIGNQKVFFRAVDKFSRTPFEEWGFNISCPYSIGGDLYSLSYNIINAGPYGGFFDRLFYSNVNLISASELVITQTLISNECADNLFYGCTSLQNLPQLKATQLYYTAMDYGSYESMFEGCTNICLSETQTGDYTIPFRIPSSGTGTAPLGSLKYMFKNTGGTFTGTPSINTTYYLKSIS